MDNLLYELEKNKVTDFRENLTVSFSAYNILDLLKVSIGSFITLYPDLKKNIVVFDDESTDGTREWLQENKIKRITWSETFKKKRDEHYKDSPTSLIYRVSLIMNDIFYQTKTKYLLYNDGDVVFTGYFLNSYEAIIKSGYKAIICRGGHGPEILNNSYFDPYEILLEEKKEYLLRAHQYHGLVDLEELKSKDMLHDRVFDSSVELEMSRPMPRIDTGLDFMYLLFAKGIFVWDLQYNSEGLQSPIYHFCLKSSIRRITDSGRSLRQENPGKNKLDIEKGLHLKNIIKLFNKDLEKKL
jgi:glycosyltransferase involved in cell wall biosynthesis